MTYALINVILLVCAMLSGFLIPIDSVFLRVMNTIDFITYFFNTWVLSEFTGAKTVLVIVDGVSMCVATWMQKSIGTALLVDQDHTYPNWDANLQYSGNSTVALTAQQAW